MYIGTLEAKSISFTHEGTSVPFPPSNTDSGLGTWAWKYLYDSPIDMNITLGQRSYVGAVTVKLNEDSGKEILWGAAPFMARFVREDGQWRLVSFIITEEAMG